MAALFLATMFPQTVVSMMSLAPPVMAREVARATGLAIETVGLYTGLVYAFVLVGNVLSPRLIARFGPLRLGFVCVVVTGLGLALFGLGWTPGLLLATLLIGLGYGPLTPASAQVMGNQAGHPSFALIVSVRQTSVPLGGALAGLVTPPLLLRFGWGETCWIMGGACALASLAMALAMPVVRRERPAPGVRGGRSLLAPLRIILARRSLLTLAGASILYGAIQLVLSAFLVAYLATVVGHDLVTAGAMLGASQVAGVAGRIGWGALADRVRVPRRLTVAVGVGMALACALTAGLAWVGPSALTLPVAILFGATASGWNGMFLAEIMREVEPDEAGLATSGSLLFTYGGIVVGPPVFGALAALVGLPGAFVAGALAALAGALLARPRPATPTAPAAG